MKKYWIAMIIAIIALSIASPVGAKQVFRWLHHESQGVGDPSFDRCLPEAAWNGHKHHVGDYQGDICIPDGGEDGGDGDGHEGNGNGGQAAEVSEPRGAITGVNFPPGQCATKAGTAFIVERDTGNTLALFHLDVGDCYSDLVQADLSSACSFPQVFWWEDGAPGFFELGVYNPWLCGGKVNMLEVFAT